MRYAFCFPVYRSNKLRSRPVVIWMESPKTLFLSHNFFMSLLCFDSYLVDVVWHKGYQTYGKKSIPNLANELKTVWPIVFILGKVMNNSDWHHIMKGRRSWTAYLCTYVCMYPSSAHSFGPIGMKLGMDIPWDPGSVIGWVASAKREAQGNEATEKREREAWWS